MTTVQLHGPVMASYDALNNRQTKSAPSKFGREEWIENSTLSLFIHTATSIGDVHENIATFRRPVTQMRIGKIEPVGVDHARTHDYVAYRIAQGF